MLFEINDLRICIESTEPWMNVYLWHQANGLSINQTHQFLSQAAVQMNVWLMLIALQSKKTVNALLYVLVSRKSKSRSDFKGYFCIFGSKRKLILCNKNFHVVWMYDWKYTTNTEQHVCRSELAITPNDCTGHLTYVQHWTNLHMYSYCMLTWWNYVF